MSEKVSCLIKNIHQSIFSNKDRTESAQINTAESRKKKYASEADLLLVKEAEARFYDGLIIQNPSVLIDFLTSLPIP